VLNKTGDENGFASLDKSVYNSGEDVVLTWKGAVVGNDFVIPQTIKYSDRTISVDMINKIDLLQTANDEYARRMDNATTMTTFEAVSEYLSKEHTEVIPHLTSDTTITIDFVKVAPVYRLYNMITSEHLFTTDKVEYDRWVNIGKTDKDWWIGEGIDWLAPTTGTTVYRLYNPALGSMARSSHYYTSDASEIASLTTPELGWTVEAAEYGFKSGGEIPIWTCYNEALGSAHHVTSSESEWKGLASHGWDLETDKNGNSGVFQAVTSVRWYTSSSYYTVYHERENIDGTYSVFETQTVAGDPGTMTNAEAKSYTGFTNENFSQVEVKNDNSTAIRIKYQRNSYDVTFVENGANPTTRTEKLKYGQAITKPEENSYDGWVFKGWYWDSTFENAFDFSQQTMPASNITIYAQWSQPVTVTFVPQNGTDSYTETVEKGSFIINPGTPVVIANGGESTTFVGWVESATMNTFDFENTSVASDITLYGVWESTYWLAPASEITTGNTKSYEVYDSVNADANVANPEFKDERIDVVAYEADIKSDIAVLRAGESDPSYAAVRQKYLDYMNSDSVHLYTRVANNGDRNDFLEFRIVEVGQHDGDGTSLTFQTIHCLTTYMGINDTNTIEGGWAKSNMRTNLQNLSELSVFADDAKAIEKTSLSRAGAEKSSQKFWIMSNSEFEGALRGEATEGSQYSFWASRNITLSTNAALKKLMYERDREASNNSLGMWTRTLNPTIDSWMFFWDGKCDSSRQMYTTWENSVVACFAL
jgi:uncharacterized repeat protein (TIGR02543 family)